MKIIGLWIRNLKDNEYPPPHELITNYDQSLKEMVIDYLNSGSIYCTYRGYHYCRFDCRNNSLGHSELTDGEWVWPESLSHYVSHHNVRIPDEFINHVKSNLANGYSTHIDFFTKVNPDDSFWISWCNENRSHSLREKLNKACNDAEIASKKQEIDLIAKYESEYGTSDQKCQWANCNRHAIFERFLCAKHLMDFSFDGANDLFYDLSCLNEN